MWGPWENSPEVRNCLISKGVHFVSRRRCDGRRKDSSAGHKEVITQGHKAGEERLLSTGKTLSTLRI